jgi:hypothetical protein
MRWAIGFQVQSSLTSHASPNDLAVVIIVIVVGEAELIWHGLRIIAQVAALQEFRMLEIPG